MNRAGGTYNYSKSKEGYDRAVSAWMSGRGYSPLIARTRRRRPANAPPATLA